MVSIEVYYYIFCVFICKLKKNRRSMNKNIVQKKANIIYATLY